MRRLIFVLLACAALNVQAKDAPATTQAADLTERQASILLQLANAEANIKAINQALVRTGYKVGLAYEQKEGSEKANELMDRKGGGPVPWDQFYGKTATGFYNRAELHAAANIGRGAAVAELDAHGSRLTPIQRPRQFDFIYRANDQQSTKAKEQIATLLQNQTALLARRQKHEADQSALWTELSLETVKDREVAFRPLYRFNLAPAGPRVALLRGPILFLRTADKATADALDSVDSHQADAFSTLQQRTKKAYATLQETMSAASIADGVTDDDRKSADELKSICKRVTEECVVASDNYRKALESDAAKEDASKLEYRAQLQTSLSKLADFMAALDEQTMKLAATWSIKPIPGTESEDKITELTQPTPVAAPPASPAPSPAAAPRQAAPNAQKDELPALQALLATCQTVKPAQDFPMTTPLSGDQTVAAGSYRLAGALKVGENRSDNAPTNVHFAPGLLLDGGQIVVVSGVLHLDGSPDHPIVLRNVAIDMDYLARCQADYVVFDHCTFGKHNALFAQSHSLKWAMSHCLFNASNWKRLTRQDAGIQIERCTMLDCKIPARTFGTKADQQPEVASLLHSGWNDVVEDNFYHCTIDTKFVWQMQRCNITDCKFIGDAKFTGKDDLTVELGQFDSDRGIFDDLRATTHSLGDGKVTYIARQEPYSNPTGLLKATAAALVK